MSATKGISARCGATCIRRATWRRFTANGCCRRSCTSTTRPGAGFGSTSYWATGSKARRSTKPSQRRPRQKTQHGWGNWPRRSTAWPQGLRRTTGHTETSNPKTAAFQHPARTIRDFNASLDDYPAALISTALHALALDPTLYVRYPDADGLLFSPQQIRTDEALREAIALFEREGLAVQYRIARLLYAPTPRLFGLPELLAWAARTGGPPCGGREGEETTGNTGGDKSGDTDGGAERYPAGNTGCGADKHTGGGTRGITGNTGYGRDKHTDGDTSGGELFAGKDGDVRNDGGAVSPELFVGNGLWGYRTPERIVIPPLYDCGFDFTEGLAAVRVGQAWHYIDIEGRTRIRCAGYEAVKPFRNGRAEVIRDGRRLEIDRAGREFEI